MVWTGFGMSTGMAVVGESGRAARARRVVGRAARVVILALLFVGVAAAPAQAREFDVTANSFTATEGVSFTKVVACWDAPTGTSHSSDFEVLIDWGDGTTSPGTVELGSFGAGDVCFQWFTSGTHTYASGGTYTFTVTVTDRVDGSIHTDTGTATVGFVPNDLSLSKGASPNPVRTSKNLTYTISVSNTSSNPAGNVQMTDTLPSGVQFVSYSTTRGSCLAPAVGTTGTITCDLGDLNGGSTAVIKVVVRVVAPGGSTLTNTASVAADDPDPVLVNNSATTTTKVFGRR